jgi:elongation factor G
MRKGVPAPLLLLALRPPSKENRQRLDEGLRQMRSEDPTLSVETDDQGDAVILGGRDEGQLERVVDRLARDFLVNAAVGRLQVAYKEALTRRADGEGRLSRQLGDRGEYAHVKVHVWPGEPGTGHVFENSLIGRAIPNRFIEPISKGIEDACGRGVLAGYPVVDVKVQLYDGSYHDVDSSEGAFEIAGAMAFHDAARKAAPILLEPLMRVGVIVPEEYAADVIANLSSRRGQIQSHGAGDPQTIEALVPMSQMFSYAADLRFRTRGRATHSLQFVSYVRFDPEMNDGDRGVLLGEPRRPTPTPKDSAIALPEPDDDGAEI